MLPRRTTPAKPHLACGPATVAQEGFEAEPISSPDLPSRVTIDPEVNASGLRQLPRETYPNAAIVGPVPFGTPFTLLCALTLMSLVVGPFAAAAALRQGPE